MEMSQWIVLMYLVPGMGVFAMLAVALLRHPTLGSSKLSYVSSQLRSLKAEDIEKLGLRVLVAHGATYITEKEQPEIEPVELVVPSRPVAESTNADSSEDSEGIFGLFDF